MPSANTATSPITSVKITPEPVEATPVEANVVIQKRGRGRPRKGEIVVRPEPKPERQVATTYVIELEADQVALVGKQYAAELRHLDQKLFEYEAVVGVEGRLAHKEEVEAVKEGISALFLTAPWLAHEPLFRVFEVEPVYQNIFERYIGRGLDVKPPDGFKETEGTFLRKLHVYPHQVDRIMRVMRFVRERGLDVSRQVGEEDRNIYALYRALVWKKRGEI